MKKSLAVLTAALLCTALLTACGGGSASEPASPEAQGVAFPTKEITIVVPFQAGGGVDVNARLMGVYLERMYGWKIVVENVTGGNTIPGALNALNRPADGHTLFANTNLSFLLAPQAYGNDFDPIQDFVPIVSNTTSPVYLSVRADNQLGIETAQDFIDWCKANPGKATIGCGGLADVTGVACYSACKALDLEVEFVPYSGSAEALVALVGGHVMFSSSPGAATASYANEGEIIPLIEFSNIEDNVLGAPTIAALGHADASRPFYRVLVANAGTDPAIVEILQEAFMAVCENQDYIAECAAGNDPVLGPMTGDALLQRMTEEYAACGPIIDELGLRNN